jgi:hypothetical protein
MNDQTDLAVEVLERAGWHRSIDGALNPPEPEPAPEVWGFTVRVEGRDEADATRFLLRTLIDGTAARDRFVVEVAGEQIWPVPS